MKQLSVVVQREKSGRVREAFDRAAIVPIGVGPTKAAGLGPAPQLKHRGSSYDDDRCVRIDAVVSDGQAEEVATLIRESCGNQGYLLWSLPIDGVNPPAVPDLEAVSR